MATAFAVATVLAAFLAVGGASAAPVSSGRDGNMKDSSVDEIAKYEAVAGLPRAETLPPRATSLQLLLSHRMRKDGF